MYKQELTRTFLYGGVLLSAKQVLKGLLFKQDKSYIGPIQIFAQEWEISKKRILDETTAGNRRIYQRHLEDLISDVCFQREYGVANSLTINGTVYNTLPARGDYFAKSFKVVKWLMIPENGPPYWMFRMVLEVGSK